MSIDDSLQRICNQAFIDRINVDELVGGDIVEASRASPSTRSSIRHSTPQH